MKGAISGFWGLGGLVSKRSYFWSACLRRNQLRRFVGFQCFENPTRSDDRVSNVLKSQPDRTIANTLLILPGSPRLSANQLLTDSFSPAWNIFIAQPSWTIAKHPIGLLVVPALTVVTAGRYVCLPHHTYMLAWKRAGSGITIRRRPTSSTSSSNRWGLELFYRKTV